MLAREPATARAERGARARTHIVENFAMCRPIARQQARLIRATIIWTLANGRVDDIDYSG
jgi:hypothetical protein